MFISFEGGEGVGKSTVLKLVTDKLKINGFDVVNTREPGGTKRAEEIREILLNNVDLTNSERMDLFVDARIDHNKEIIKKALQNNKIVLSDRYFDSTFVYQGILISDSDLEMAITKNNIENIEKPDLTFILDLDEKKAIERINRNNREKNFLDDLPLEHHSKVRNGFLMLEKLKKERYKDIFTNQHTVVINVNRSLDDIVDEIYQIIISRMS